MMAHPLQQLYDACKETFSTPGLPPSPQGLLHVKSLIDAMTLADLGLDEDILALSNQGSESLPSVYYLHIHECESFSMGIFYLPASAVIPLHDHPEMTVFSKLLHGSVHVKAYDWVEPVVQRPNSDMIKGNSTPSLSSPAGFGASNTIAYSSELATTGRLAKLVVEQIYTAPCEASILYPTGGGNIHTLTGVTHCAVLDVLVPPYNNKDRPCTYYRDYINSNSDPLVKALNNDIDDQILAWLEVFQPPYDHVKSVRYEPPAIIL